MLHTDFILIRHSTPVEGQPVPNLILTIEEAHEEEQENEIDVDLNLVEFKEANFIVQKLSKMGLCDVQCIREENYCILILSLKRDKGMPLVARDPDEGDRSHEGEEIPKPAVELREVAVVNDTDEEQEAIVELIRGKSVRIECGEVDKD
uniref:Uncharacterized protein n=1 Tax=Lutzomyia longipalpis TaxID=7200 RepID=A0A7G3B462_LUTLO